MGNYSNKPISNKQARQFVKFIASCPLQMSRERERSLISIYHQIIVQTHPEKHTLINLSRANACFCFLDHQDLQNTCIILV